MAAQGKIRDIREQLQRLAISAGVMAVSLVVALTGLVLIIVAATIALADVMGPAGAALFVGVLTLLVGGGGALLGRRLARSPRQPPTRAAPATAPSGAPDPYRVAGGISSILGGSAEDLKLWAQRNSKKVTLAALGVGLALSIPRVRRALSRLF